MIFRAEPAKVPPVKPSCFPTLLSLLTFACSSPSSMGRDNVTPTCATEPLPRGPNVPSDTPAILNPQDSSTLKAVTYNIRSGLGAGTWFAPPAEGMLSRLREISAAVAQAFEAPPDLVALNEVDFASRRTGFADQAAMIADHLLRLTGHRYRVLRNVSWVRSTPGREVRFGNALLTRHPVVEFESCLFGSSSCAPNTADPSSKPSPFWSWLSAEPRGYLKARVAVAGDPVTVIVTHLDPFTAAIREHQAAYLLKSVVPKTGTAILLGDLNTVPTELTSQRPFFAADRAHDVLSSGRLLDARVDLRWSGHEHTTNWATYPSDSPRWPLDAIFASIDLSARIARPIGQTASDHVGLAVKLRRLQDTGQIEARLHRLRRIQVFRLRRLKQCDKAPDRIIAMLRALMQTEAPPPTNGTHLADKAHQGGARSHQTSRGEMAATRVPVREKDPVGDGVAAGPRHLRTLVRSQGLRTGPP